MNAASLVKWLEVNSQKIADASKGHNDMAYEWILEAEDIRKIPDDQLSTSMFKISETKSKDFSKLDILLQSTLVDMLRRSPKHDELYRKMAAKVAELKANGERGKRLMKGRQT